jgi:hypothetical protein
MDNTIIEIIIIFFTNACFSLVSISALFLASSKSFFSTSNLVCASENCNAVSDEKIESFC